MKIIIQLWGSIFTVIHDKDIINKNDIRLNFQHMNEENNIDTSFEWKIFNSCVKRSEFNKF